ncbi:MerR family transcriptional regulator [Salegentibacter salinarum]|uniref:MerR family transcriptional regulator n=1 Tax=Salegentibacter salinarum TaxID=447422 RepID=A0A2N0U332_9FLAO|nr:chaperone modulator CbpM [Salegentibacter salinarum]PKD21413.1 MerR family transcriptional regulator [Salegentibacter salinarum]SKB39061.1 MerR HTH family regulatory protein [Salegentibacter salinarum]
MNLEDLIPTDEICSRYKVERTFVSSLYESGLIEIVTVEETEYVHCDEISEFERLRRLHYDLDINVEGLEAIQHLIRQVKILQKQNRKLKNRLGLYE